EHEAQSSDGVHVAGVATPDLVEGRHPLRTHTAQRRRSGPCGTVEVPEDTADVRLRRIAADSPDIVRRAAPDAEHYVATRRCLPLKRAVEKIVAYDQTVLTGHVECAVDRGDADPPQVAGCAAAETAPYPAAVVEDVRPHPIVRV